MMRRLTPTEASGGRTLFAGLPCICVTAQVVRTRAFSSPPMSRVARSSAGLNSQRFANTMRTGQMERRPRVSNISAAGGVSVKGAGLFSIRVTARASLPAIVLRGGAEAWPPSLFMSRKSCI